MEAPIEGGTDEKEPKEQAKHPVGQRCYSKYKNDGRLSFDPFEELNLPKDYNEVVSRFKRLQGERAVEVLN